MSRQAFKRTLVASLLTMTSVGASAQLVRPESPNVVLAPKATALSATFGSRASGITTARSPARLSQAEYLTMRPKLAALVNVTETQLPSQPIAAPSLATPGSVLNVGLGTQPPGAGIELADVYFNSGSSALLGALSAPVAVARSNTASILFVAPIPGPGTYLITVYAYSPTGTVPVVLAAGSGSAWDISPAITLPVQAGKLFVVKDVAVTSARELAISIGPGAFGAQVFSCDFMRIK